MPTYIADFETTTETGYDKDGEVRVWLWGLYSKEKEVLKIGKTLNSFMREVEKLPNSTKVYYHNLKFDISYMFYWLFGNGYEHIHSPGVRMKLEDKQFSIIMSDMGQMFECKIKIGNNLVTFWDSAKKMPMSLKKVAKAFDTPMKKGEIDHKKYRPVGHDPTQDEIEYVIDDVKIVANALEYFSDNNLNKMTIAGCAMWDYKQRMNKNNKKTFDRHFPKFPIELDTFCRKAYKGGFTYVNPKYQNVDVGRGQTYDINSQYPYCMWYYKLPYGEPLYFEGGYPENESMYDLYIIQIECSFELKEGYLPTLQLKKDTRFPPTKYLTSSRVKGKLLTVPVVLTSVDYELFLEHYEVKNLVEVCGWMFRSKDTLFKEYIEYWMGIKEWAKENDNPGMVQIAKLMLNSLYGKFGKNPRVLSKYPIYTIDKNGNPLVKYKVDEEARIEKPIYVPIAAFVTSYARRMTIQAAQKNYDRFAYADTDSMHLDGWEEPTGINIHKTKLGYWDHEADWVRGKFIRPKTYCEEHLISKEKYDKLEEEEKKEGWIYNLQYEGYTKLEFTVAGLPDNGKANLNWGNFKVGSKVDGKTEARLVSGGTVILDKKFTIKG